jgi:ParB family transcriptional regulator, chromosome partitioning protein
MGSSINTISVVRDIPLNKLVPSKVNVRQTGRESGVDELAASILAHGVLQNLTVRPQLDDENRETGKYEVIAGGRRLAALKLLVQQKRIAKTAPITCNIREDGIARELSLVENVQRVNLHPADQFVAFRALHEDEGLGAEDIAARFGVTARTVKERLKLAAVSPRLLDKYRDGDLTLDQIMAFAVVDDPLRQEEVWGGLAYNKSPDFIRRALLQSHVPAQDKRAVFVGLEAYETAGGPLLRDLFSEDGGGYLSDPALLDRLARNKLEEAAATIRGEGWKWVECSPDFPHALGLRRVYPHEVELPAADSQRLEAIESELDRLGAEYEAGDAGNPELETQMAALSAEYDAIDAKGRVFDPDAVARAGAILSIGPDGDLVVTRGLIRPEDEPKAVSQPDDAHTGRESQHEPKDNSEHSSLSDRLVADLSAHRTMAMRDRLGANPEAAHLALTHALALQMFYLCDRGESCLDLHASSLSLEGHAPGIGDSPAAHSVSARQDAWAVRMPKDDQDLWTFILALQDRERQALFAHCVSLLVNAVEDCGGSRNASADALALVLALDMRSYWTPTAASYLSRVSKALILQAVQEGVSADAADGLRALKKAEMAQAAEHLLTATGWLPELLRCPPKADNAQTEDEQVAAAE